VLERYRLLKRLGTGGFGTVWMARDERLEREVAVKILPRDRVVGGRFEREARAAARLSHPGIVTLYEASVDDDGAYLVSELVRGPTLDKLLAKGRLSDRDIVAVGVVLCDALDHAHGEGVVHRDVKPSNILVPTRPPSPSQMAKLTDFGVARIVGGDTLTRTGDVVGTLAYMAPEQAEGLEAGPAADLYSLALALYEALTGLNPVRAPTGSSCPRRLGTYLPPLRRQRRDLPRELGQGIDMALRPRPRERGRVSDLRRALIAARELVGDEAGVVAAPWRPRTATAVAAPWRPSAGPVPPPRQPEPEDFAPVRRPPAPDEGPDAEAGSRPSGWVSRGLAALATALTVAWLARHVLSGPPVPPALLGLLAAGAVLLVPRLGWFAVSAAAAGAALAQGHPGFALLVLTAGWLPMLLAPRRPTTWPLSAGAPLLGLLSLGGAWPAAAGRAGTIWSRAVLGAMGWIWLLVASILLHRGLYLSWLPASSAAGWPASPRSTVDQVLVPLWQSGVLAPALVWGGAAVVLPWLVRGRSLAVDAVLVVVWSATTAAATTAVIAAVHGSQGVPTAPAGIVGAIFGSIVALVPVWMPPLQTLWRPLRLGRAGRQFP
jgi:serine/threonine protein kinase